MKRLSFPLMVFVLCLVSVFAGAKPSADSLFEKANADFKQGKLNLALESYQEAIALDGEVGRYHLQLGMVLDALERFEPAIAAYKKALGLERDAEQKSLIYNNLGVSYGKTGRTQDAIQAFQNSLEAQPDYVGALYNLGYAYHASGNARAARIQYEKLKTLNIEMAQMLQEKISPSLPK